MPMRKRAIGHSNRGDMGLTSLELAWAQRHSFFKSVTAAPRSKREGEFSFAVKPKKLRMSFKNARRDYLAHELGI